MNADGEMGSVEEFVGGNLQCGFVGTPKYPQLQIIYFIFTYTIREIIHEDISRQHPSGSETVEAPSTVPKRQDHVTASTGPYQKISMPESVGREHGEMLLDCAGYPLI